MPAYDTIPVRVLAPGARVDGQPSASRTLEYVAQGRFLRAGSRGLIEEALVDVPVGSETLELTVWNDAIDSSYRLEALGVTYQVRGSRPAPPLGIGGQYFVDPVEAGE